jgi:hypothetical protein
MDRRFGAADVSLSPCRHGGDLLGLTSEVDLVEEELESAAGDALALAADGA